MVSAGHKTLDVCGPAVVIENKGLSYTETKLTDFIPDKPGQLSYIDGCSNSNLIDPYRNGDPCLNYLFFPAGIEQTFHTHPSFRIGYVLSGKGYAEIKRSKDVVESVPLEQDTVFVLDRHTLHRFITLEDNMSLAVYHPDSEDGPRDELNPMMSRTYLR